MSISRAIIEVAVTFLFPLFKIGFRFSVLLCSPPATNIFFKSLLKTENRNRRAGDFGGNPCTGSHFLPFTATNSRLAQWDAMPCLHGCYGLRGRRPGVPSTSRPPRWTGQAAGVRRTLADPLMETGQARTWRRRARRRNQDRRQCLLACHRSEPCGSCMPCRCRSRKPEPGRIRPLSLRWLGGAPVQRQADKTGKEEGALGLCLDGHI